jgi:cytochrome c biogenesis factor
MTAHVEAPCPFEEEILMKPIVFVLIALSVLIGAVAPAGADPFNAKQFFEQSDRFGGGSNGR